MLQSSLGFHTMTLFLPLSGTKVEKLIKHFCRYRKNTKQIRIFIRKNALPGEKPTYSEYTPTYSGTRLLLPFNLQIIYPEKDCGIKWIVRANSRNESFSSYTVEATINPKILGGIQDYITAASLDDMWSAIKKFNSISSSISPLLRTFECYEPKRIDYCINFALNELVPSCASSKVMDLIKRGDIPPKYEQWMLYSSISHRKKSVPGSFYLKCQSANINCYEKYIELQKRNQNNPDSVSQEVLAKAQDIIRFEVQCKYPKARTLSKQAESIGYFGTDKYRYLLDYKACLIKINSYYGETIGRGDWFTVSEAERIIRSHRYNSQKEQRLIAALQRVSQCRSLASAKASYQGSDLAAFKRTLKDLSDIGINPVTIPRDWGIKHIPNLMHTYNDTSLARTAWPDIQLI